MLKFENIEIIKIPGRGDVAPVFIDPKSDLPRKGEHVSINGDIRFVLGCEVMYSLTAPPMRQGQIGLVVSSVFNLNK